MTEPKAVPTATEPGLEGWWEKRQAGITRTTISLFLIALVDVLVCVVLLEDTNGWSSEIWAPRNFFGSFWDFDDKTSDVFVLVLLRVAGVCVLTVVARKISRDEQSSQFSASDDFNGRETENENKKEKKQKQGSEMSQPLLSVTNEKEDVMRGKERNQNYESSGVIASKEKSSTGVSDVARAKQKEKTAHSVKKLTERERHSKIFLSISFGFLTLFQIHAGLKCVSFNFTRETFQGVLMGLPVLIINIELWFFEKLIGLLTEGEGYLWKDVHSHRMYFSELKFHWCNMCRQRIDNGYGCTTCNFDMCMDCFYKKNKSNAEGVLRGDKGMKAEQELSTGTYMLKALKLASPSWLLIVVAVVCLLTTSASSLFLPNYQGTILDDVIHLDQQNFMTHITIYLLLSVAVGLFGGLRTLCFNIVGRKMSNGIQVELFENMIFQDIAYFDGTTTGQLTSSLTNDISQMVSPMQTMLNTLISNAILLGGGLVMCFYTSWRLSMLAFTTVGPIVYITKVYAKWSRTINRDILAALADANSNATQAIGNIRTVRAFSTELEEIRKYHEATTIALKKGIRDAVVSGGTFALTNYLDLGAGVLVLWYGGSVVMNDPNTLQVGNLITFQLYWNMINNSYTSLQSVMSSFTRAAGAAQRVLSLIENTPDIGPKGGIPVVFEKVKGTLLLEDVCFAYQMRPDQMVLKGVTLEIKAGQTLALVGRSGGGKSTLVHLLMRFYDPKSGRISLDGVPLPELNLLDLHKCMGLVQQETQLFAMSIEQNIGYGTENYTMEQVYEAAKLANCHDFIMEFDDGYQTRVGERGVRLSGGQKQRIAIARVLMRRPRLLFLDEATSALDTESEAAVQAALDNLIKLAGCTVVLVAHRLSTVVNADKIAVVFSGQIVEQGTHQELLELKGAYARLVSRQITRERNQIDNDGNKPKEIAIDALMLEEEEEKNPEHQQRKLREADKIDSLLAEEMEETKKAKTKAPNDEEGKKEQTNVKAEETKTESSV